MATEIARAGAMWSQLAAVVAAIGDVVAELQALIAALQALLLAYWGRVGDIQQVFDAFSSFIDVVFNAEVTEYDLSWMDDSCLFVAVRLYEWMATNTVLGWYYVLGVVIVLTENILWFLDYFGD